MAADHFRAALEFWAENAGRPLFVGRCLAVRWIQERPNVGVDPDVCLLDPPPPDVLSLRSLCLWKPGHLAPPLSLEVVNDTHPYKDYVDVHERYAAFGARELIVFDPLLAGPQSLGGPIALQVWRRNDIDVFERQYAGPGPVFCEVLGAWLVVDGRLLHVAEDRAGRQRWPTASERVEHERAEKERERAERERERAEKERAQAEAQREHQRRLDVERRLAALEEQLSGAKKH
jgi:hypothetical protein